MTTSLVICLLPAVGIALYSWAGLNLILEAARQEEKIDESAAVCAAQQKAALECRRYEKDMLLNGADAGATAEYLDKWRAQVALLSKGIAELSEEFTETEGAMSHDAPGRAVIADLSGNLESYRVGVERVVAEAAAAGAAEPALLNTALTPHKVHIHRLATGLDTLQERIHAQIEAREQNLHGELERLATRLLVGIAVAATLGLVSVCVLPRLLTRRVRKLGEFADAVRAGDLSARSEVGGEDEVGRLSRALNQMLDTLAVAVDRERAAARAEAEARQAGESKARFMANMSHEI
ncbi:MAG TPA: HAMP domain-containing protein, partial [Phycisphaerales bacterium]|nr:HAMP domain-containing protein [Phycisphaerales bacterium]